MALSNPYQIDSTLEELQTTAELSPSLNSPLKDKANAQQTNSYNHIVNKVNSNDNSLQTHDTNTKLEQIDVIERGRKLLQRYRDHTKSIKANRAQDTNSNVKSLDTSHFLSQSRNETNQKIRWELAMGLHLPNSEALWQHAYHVKAQEIESLVHTIPLPEEWEMCSSAPDIDNSLVYFRLRDASESCIVLEDPRVPILIQSLDNKQRKIIEYSTNMVQIESTPVSNIIVQDLQSQMDQALVYTVEFGENEPISINFRPLSNDAGVVISEILPGMTEEKMHQLQANDHLVAVNDRRVEKAPSSHIKLLLAGRLRPLKLTFSRPYGSSSIINDQRTGLQYRMDAHTLQSNGSVNRDSEEELTIADHVISSIFRVFWNPPNNEAVHTV